MKIRFNLVGSATWVLDIDGKFKIACDPALAEEGTKYVYKGLKTSRVKPPVYNEETFENTKLWVITHGHFDHLDEIGAKMIEEGSKVVSNKNASRLLKKVRGADITYLKWSENKRFNIEGYMIKVEVIPAVHGMNLLARILMGGVNGYLISITKNGISRKIYVTSDTVYSKEIIELLENKRINVMIANLGQAKSNMIGGPFTMDVNMLNKFIEKLNPNVVIPIHINDFAHFETTEEELENINNKEKVIILKSGESTIIK